MVYCDKMAAASGLLIIPSSIVAYIARCCFKSSSTNTETDDVSEGVTSRECDNLTSAEKCGNYDSISKDRAGAVREEAIKRKPLL